MVNNGYPLYVQHRTGHGVGYQGSRGFVIVQGRNKRRPSGVAVGTRERRRWQWCGVRFL
jgi:hypothetical protein